MSNASAPALVANLPIAGDCEAIAMDGGLAFVGNGAGWSVVDIRNPSAPAILATMDPNVRVSCISAAAHRALITDSKVFAYLYDVSNPSAPKLARTWYPLTSGALVTNDVAYTSDNTAFVDYLVFHWDSSGLTVSDSTQRDYGRLATVPAQIKNASVRNDKIYLADYRQGVVVYRWNLTLRVGLKPLGPRYYAGDKIHIEWYAHGLVNPQWKIEFGTTAVPMPPVYDGGDLWHADFVLPRPSGIGSTAIWLSDATSGQRTLSTDFDLVDFPRLSIFNQPDAPVVSWPQGRGDYTLYQSTNLNGAWTRAGTNFASVPAFGSLLYFKPAPTKGQIFFQLKREP